MGSQGTQECRNSILTAGALAGGAPFRGVFAPVGTKGIQMNRTAGAIALVLCSLGLTGCDARSMPTAPSPAAGFQQPTPAVVTLRTFTDPRSGFSTSDLRDAGDDIVQFNSSNELIWTANSTHLPGYFVRGNTIPADAACVCELVVRFGSSNGERRAYLTADYGHDNPGTLVDLDVVNGVLVAKRTEVFAPGTLTVSGVITEMTASGVLPLEDAGVWALNEEQGGWQVARTDKNGFYELRGQYDGSKRIAVIKDGYETTNTVVIIEGNTRFDSQLTRR